MRKDTSNLVIRAYLALFESLFIEVQVLKALPKVEVEALIALCTLPVFCEFIYVTSGVSKEELGDILIKVLVSFVVISSEVNGLRELPTIVVPYLADLNEFASVFIYQQLQLGIKLFDSVFILLARVTNKFLQSI